MNEDTLQNTYTAAIRDMIEDAEEIMTAVKESAGLVMEPEKAEEDDDATVQAIEEEITKEFKVVEEVPAAEEPAVEEAPVVEEVVEAAAEKVEDATADFKLNLDELKFGRNYGSDN